MAQPPDFSQFQLLPAQSTPSTKERKAGAEATAAEEEAPYAGRKAKASAELTEAQAERARAAAAKEKVAADAIEAKAAEAEAGKGRQQTERAETLAGYLGRLQRTRDVLSSGVATGIPGQLTGSIWGTPAADLKGLLEGIANPIVLEAMAEARKGSAAGATGFGALSQKELELLKSKFGSLRQAQSAPQILSVLDEIDQSYRRFMAYNAGYDPYKPEGALLVGLPMPEGAEVPPEDVEIGPAGGTWTEDPELRGVNAAVISMIKANRSPDQIRAWLDSYQPGLGDRITGLEGQIQYYKKTGKDPQGVVGKQYTPPEGGETTLSKAADTGAGAFAVSAADQLMSGFMGEAAAGEMSGPEYERTATVLRGLRSKYPGWSTAGDLTGGVLSAASGAAAGMKAGLRLPSLFEGMGQEALYGIGSAEPGQRTEGGISSALMAPATNLIGKVGSDAVGSVLRGADPTRAALVEKYGINLTPGQLTGRSAGERSIAGLPVLGPQITDRRNESLKQFNQAAFGEALAPIGTRTNNIGQRGIAEAQKAVSDAYDTALGGRTFQFDAPFVQTVRGKPYAELANMKGETGPALAAEIDRILAEVNVNGTVDGRAWQQARRQLVDLQAKSDVKDNIASETILNNLGDIIDGFDGLVQRQAPDVFDGYMAANSAYRNVKTLERAVDNASSGDVFGPGNLRTATKISTQKFGGSAASARGDRPFNDLVMSALDVVPNKADDVSMTGRFIAPAAGAGGFGAITATGMLASPENDRVADEGDGTVPAWMLAAAAGTGLATLPFSKRGIGLSTRPLLGPRTDRQRMLGEMLQNYGPAVLRGVTRDAEPGAPMPEDFDYSRMGSADFRKLVQAAAAGAQPLTPEEKAQIGTGGEFTDVDAAGNPAPPAGASPMSIDGRPVERDPATGEMIFSDTGEPVPGFKKGGQVSSADWRGRARSVGQGVTFGFGDELEGGFRALGSALTDGDITALKQKYLQQRDRVRRQQTAYEEANPYESLGYEMGGAMLTGLIPGAQGATGAKLATLASRYPRAARAAAVAADTAAYGAGSAESIRDIPRSIRDEALFAVPMYAGAEGVRAGVNRYRGRRKK
jgi:hypothetical protein